MGGSQSKLLKKELAELKSEAARTRLKHEEEIEGVKRAKRELEFKLGVLQELTAQAELAAEKANQLAFESEERAKALKWELVRKLTVSTTVLSTCALPAATSLAAAESSSPRVALNWKLRDGVTVRRSSTSTLPSSDTVDQANATRLDKQRPHAQSEPVVPLGQVQRRQDPKASSLHLEATSSRKDASDPSARAKTANNNNTDETKATESAAPARQFASHSTSSSASSSSEDEKPKTKYPALSRNQSARVPAPQAVDESKASSSDQSEPESELLTRRVRAHERKTKSRETDREAKREESERADSYHDISTSRRSRDEEEVLAFSNVEDDSS